MRLCALLHSSSMDSSNYRNAMRVKPANSEFDGGFACAQRWRIRRFNSLTLSLTRSFLSPSPGTAQLVMYLPKGDVPESVWSSSAACLFLSSFVPLSDSLALPCRCAPSSPLSSPWYGSSAGFTDCYNLLNNNVSRIFDTIAKAHGKVAL